MKPDVSEKEARAPKWEALVLVCKACGKRSSGPKDKALKPKQVMQELRSAAKRQRVRSRVVLTTCLGLCPKRATAVVVALPGGAQTTTAVASQPILEHVASLLCSSGEAASSPGIPALPGTEV